MSDPRVIKKYPNRRLYDHRGKTPATSRWRTCRQSGASRWLGKKIDFVVGGKRKINADITRQICCM